jgi:ABC-2 type transport system ATP-binding protein
VEFAITCEGLVKRYHDVVALDHLSLSVPQGSIFGFLGPNGAGKTTAIRLLTGLARATEGRATVAGFNVGADSVALRERISYLDQQPQFYSWMRGRELLEFVGELYGLTGSELRKRVDEVLEISGLSEAARRKVGGYSGGMRQRLGLAQALINEPEVLFLDEPVSALDPAGRHDILQIIEQLRGRATVFMSSHILADIERVCDRVAIINDGRLIVESTVSDLQARYALPIFLLQFDDGNDPRVDALQSRLQSEPWVTNVTRERDELRVSTDDPTTASSALLRLVADTGLSLVKFERARPSLEDIFLRLVSVIPVDEESGRS